MDDASNQDPVSAPAASPHDVDHHPAAAADFRGEPDRLAFVPPRLPESTGAWLHVVSGPTVPAITRAVFELAARFLAGGQRVLLVDGAPRLRLHERFDRESRWGISECLGGRLPVLGLVQDTGRLGLYLLAHGAATPDAPWPQLGRVLEAARPYFGRLVLALDAEVPAAVREALAARHLEGWWAQAERSTRGTDHIAGRLGINFNDLDLDGMLIPRLEALDARIWTLIAAQREAGTQVPHGADPEPPDPAPIPLPQGLDCDLRVRERLRFLLWMRRVEAEGQDAAAAEG